jgi:hypothetical protein
VITSTSGTNTGTVQFQTDYTIRRVPAINSVIPLLSDNATAFSDRNRREPPAPHGDSRNRINNGAANIVVKLVVTGTVAVTAAATVEQIA